MQFQLAFLHCASSAWGCPIKLTCSQPSFTSPVWMHPNHLVFRQGGVHPACQVARQDGLYVCLPQFFFTRATRKLPLALVFSCIFVGCVPDPSGHCFRPNKIEKLHTRQSARIPRSFLRSTFASPERFRTAPNGSNRLLAGSGAMRASALEFQSLGGVWTLHLFVSSQPLAKAIGLESASSETALTASP